MCSASAVYQVNLTMQAYFYNILNIYNRISPVILITLLFKVWGFFILFIYLFMFFNAFMITKAAFIR